jgi:cell division septation protein DedD
VPLPTKLSGKSSARVAVAKTDTTAPGAATDTQNDQVQQSVPTKSEKPAKAPKIQQAAAETSPVATTPAAVEAPAATSSTGWAVQLAAPKSEAEAKSTAARLGSKYESVLNGSPIGVHKALVNGETIYRLRVVGLSKADAAALCARLKGDGGDCFIAK